jgi:hypothetical protein
MQKFLPLLLSVTALSAAGTLAAQMVDPNAASTQPQAAPIVRSGPAAASANGSQRLHYAYLAEAPEGQRPAAPQPMPQAPKINQMQPAQGIFVRSAADAAVTKVSATGDTTELRVEHGLANVSVRHPADNSQILVDLPGGQVALEKDGLYTFNANSNTVRVLQGEAAAFPNGSGKDAKGITLKEDRALSFAGPNPKATDSYPAQSRADLLPGGQRPYNAEPDYGYAYGPGYYRAPYYAYGYGYEYPYGYPYAPYYAYDYPYWGYGYPFGFGLGFGYYGGFGGRFGGFRGFRR